MRLRMPAHHLAKRNHQTWVGSSWLRGAYLLLLCLWCVPRPSSAGSGRALLVLNVVEASRSHETLRLQVSDFLRRAGARLVESGRLSQAMRSCAESSCLNLIAERHRAELILAARIEHHGARDRIIYMWLYDAQSGRDQSERVVCDAMDLEERLREVAGRLFGPYLQEGEKEPPAPTSQSIPTAAEPAVAAAPEVTPAEAPSPILRPPPPPAATARAPEPALLAALPSRPRMPLGTPRARAALALGLLSIGALTVAIPLHALSGMATDSTALPGAGHVYAYQPLFIPLYATAGALAVSTALTLAWPAKKEVRK